MEESFRAMVVSKDGNNQCRRQIVRRQVSHLPEGDVLIKVHYSSLNYKDALSASGNTGVTRHYPHTPGIDAAGIVMESADPMIKAGSQVIVTSYDLGMNTPGGFGQYIRVPSDWVVPLPAGLSLRQAMCYGTAGFTAALSVFQLTRLGVQPEQGEILVSGAIGGVGSIAVSLLAQQGYSVAALNGKTDQSEYLKSLGARHIVDICDAIDTSKKPLLAGRWAGSIDVVGGDILASTIKSTKANGVVTTCGNAASFDLPVTVYPFILRGIVLVGIDSQNCPMDLRCQVWQKIASEWQIAGMEKLVGEISLNELDRWIDKMLNRETKGRMIVNMQS